MTEVCRNWLQTQLCVLGRAFHMLVLPVSCKLKYLHRSTSMLQRTVYSLIIR